MSVQGLADKHIMPELQLLPEKTTRVQLRTPRKLGLGFLFLTIVLVLYGGLFFYNRGLEADIKNLDGQILAFNQARDRDLESRVAEVDSKLVQSQTLLDEHVIWSKGFQKIQSLTLPSVQFQFLTASLPELKFEFRAFAPNLTSIAKQGANFLAEDSITDLAVSQIKILTDGRIEFAVRLTFDREKFLK